MAKKICRIVFFITMIITLSLIFQTSVSKIVNAQEQTSPTMVILQAGSGETIQFQTNNGITRQGVKPEVTQIPRLTLFQNHLLTNASQRTLQITINGLHIPSPGATVTLLVETQEKSAEFLDPSLDSYQKKRIPLWWASSWIAPSEGKDLKGSSLSISQTFDETVSRSVGQIGTPTGYFRYLITISSTGDSTDTILYEFQQDYAFLMENIWISTLPNVPEESTGAAPDELVIYYCDTTRFQKDLRDVSNFIPRHIIHEYVGTELAPRMVEAFRLQSQDWGFPWYQAWTGNRAGPDRERLSVALTDRETWYHGQASPTGNSRISINVSGGDNAAYDSLADGVMSTFHHELFHLHQKNINQFFGGQGWTGGIKGQWQFFSEGMAVMASSVAQPEIEFAESGESRAYISNANFFLEGDIGEHFGQINPYHSALYWRFLYEHCGGMSSRVENPAAGMQIIRQVLSNLYKTTQRQDIADLSLDELIPRIMDQAFAGSFCSFQTYEDSLAAFARALNALRFEHGRCKSPGLPAGCAFFDPHILYKNPPVDTLARMVILP